MLKVKQGRRPNNNREIRSKNVDLFPPPEQQKAGLNKMNIRYKTASDAESCRAHAGRGQRSCMLKGCGLSQRATDVSPSSSSLAPRGGRRRWIQPSWGGPPACGGDGVGKVMLCIVTASHRLPFLALKHSFLPTATSEHHQYDGNTAFPSKRRMAASEIPLSLSVVDVISEERQQCGPALHTKAPCSLLFCSWLSRKLPPSLTHHLRAAVLTKLLIESLLRQSRALRNIHIFNKRPFCGVFRNPKSLDAAQNRNTRICWKVWVRATEWWKLLPVL